MQSSFDVSVDFPASVEQVQSVFGDEDYWRARLAAFDTGSATLNSLIVNADGTTIVATTLGVLRDRLPRLITQLHLGDLEVVHNETWSRIGDGQVRGEVSLAVPGAPLSALSAALLAPVPSGSRLTYAATVEARVPLVGGPIASFIGGQLVEGVVAIHYFTRAWIAENG